MAKKWIIITVVSLVGVLSLGTIGYFVFNKKNKNNKNNKNNIINVKKFTAKYKGKDIKPIESIDDRDSSGKSTFLELSGLYGAANVFGIVDNNIYYITGKIQGGSDNIFVQKIKVAPSDLYDLKIL